MRSTGLAKALLVGAAPLAFTVSWAQALPQFVGDLGLAVFRTPPITRTTDASHTVLPYVYGDAGALYARVDTFGYKLAPLGLGHLELAARVSVEGYRPSQPALDPRATPRPVGLSTFQETPYGGVFVYALRDAVSDGTLLDVSYAAEWSHGAVHVYPQAGIERRSARYADHLYGVSAAQSLRSGIGPYATGSSTTPNLGVAVEYEWTDRWKLVGQVRRRWLDKRLTHSPLVDARTQTSSFVAVTRTFK